MDFINCDDENIKFKNEEYNFSSRRIQMTADDASSRSIACNKQEFIEASQLLNKKDISPTSKKKSRKPKTMGEKKDSLSKTCLPKAFAEVTLEETEEFSGFDSKDIEIFDHDSKILNKLLDEAEMMNNLSLKSQKTSMILWRTTDNFMEEIDETTTDSEDHRMITESNISNPALDETSCNIENLENNTPMYYNRVKKNKLSRVSSPSTTTRQKVSVDVSNPVYKEPFNYGWKRELVYRAGTSENQTRRMADIYYYTPEGKKVRSYREVIEFLTASELTIDNFTFFKEPLGVNDPNKEIIRDAKKTKDYLNSKFAVTQLKKSETLPAKKLSNKKVTEKCMSEAESISITKSSKSAATFKVKVPTKKATSKKTEIEEITCFSTAPATTIEEVSAVPQWKPFPTRKSLQFEKISMVKPKKITKKRQVIPELDHRQHFMVSVCAGYNALSRIFQYLTVQELLRAARVCRMWRDLAAHSLLWKTVRMKNSQVTDWDGSANTLKNRGTQHLDLRKMLIVDEAEIIWKEFVNAIPKVSSLMKLELCRCPAIVVEEIMKKCPQLRVLSAMSIECDTFDLQFVANLNHCNELRLKAISGMSLHGDLTPLLKLSKITHLSLTSVKDLGKKKIEVLQSLQRLEILELGECSDFSDKFGTTVLSKLQKLERLRLEKGQGSCCTFDILDGISKMQNLTQLELVNFDVKNGFDKCLAACKNLKRLLIIPTYVSQSATSNNMILGGVTQLSNNLTHFVWGVTQELLKVTLLFVDQCNQMSKQITGDSIPVLKPVPCLELIEDVMGDKNFSKVGNEEKSNLSNPQVEILPLPHLQKLLLTALPKTRVKILKIPFYATWRQSISDSTSQ